MRFLDRVADNLDALLSYMHGAVFRTNPRLFLDIASTDDDHTFVTKGGSLLTIFKVDGLSSQVGEEQFRELSRELKGIFSDLLSDRMKGAHEIAVAFEFDPESVGDEIDQALAPTLAQAKRLGLGDTVDMLFREKRNRLAQYCQSESCYLGIFTHPRIIDKSDIKNEVQQRNEAIKRWPFTVESLLLDGVFPGMRSKHSSAVRTFRSKMSKLISVEHTGYLMSMVSVSEYLRCLKGHIEHGQAGPKWQPRVGASDILKDIRLPVKPNGLMAPEAFDHMMPPSFGEQLMSSMPKTIGLKYAVMGDRIFATAALHLGPKEPASFDELIRQASHLKLPFRILFSFKADGLGFDKLNQTFASWFRWAGMGNRQITDATKGLSEYIEKHNGVVPGLFIQACTWAPVKPYSNDKGELFYDLSLISQRSSNLHRALQSWGGCQTTDGYNAPIEGVLASSIGGYGKPLGRVMVPPLEDAAAISPLFRPTTSWQDGNVLMRTEDGRILKYKQTDKNQSAWVTLVVGPMGFSKSTELNTLNLYYLMTPAAERDFPYLRIMDIGPSSRAIIDMVQNALPVNKKHMAQYIRMQNTTQYRYNILDTPLGVEQPLSSHVDFLNNFLITIAYSLSKDPQAASRLPGLVATCVRELYKAYSSTGDFAQRYYPGANQMVDSKLAEQGFVPDAMTTWHEVRDFLFDREELRAALIAHRKAMPILSHLLGIVSAPSIRAEYTDTIGNTSLLDLFARAIKEAIEMFPILDGETVFELGETRVISLDLEDMIPKDDSERSLWRGTIVCLFSFHLLTADFFLHPDYVAAMPKRYQRYHLARITQLSQIRKRFSMDERKRFAAIDAAAAQVDNMILEGRKNHVDMMLASQFFKHHSPTSVELATTIVILGAGNLSEHDIKDIQTRFELNDHQMRTIRNIRPPTEKGAEALMIFKTRSGTEVHHVFKTEGPIYLWAVATEAVDRSIKKLMYERCGGNELEAWRRLATLHPGGSIKKALDNRLAALNDHKVGEGDILEQFADELMALNLADCYAV